MTWAFGLKSQNAVYLIADSAITSDKACGTSISTFGESSFQNGQIHVEEGALKIFRVGRILVTYSGHKVAGDAFIQCLESIAIEDSSKSIDRIIADAAVRTVFPLGCSASILIAFYDSTPRLRLLESARGELTDVEQKHIGSVSPDFVGFTDRLLGALNALPAFTSSPESKQWIVKPLALFQSYGMSHYLMNSGIGGAFAGASVDQVGVHWQPDTLFVIHNCNPAELLSSKVVGLFFRNDCMSVVSAFKAGTSVFLHKRLSESNADAESRGRASGTAAELQFETAEFYYIVFLNFEIHMLTIVEMRGERKHRLLTVEHMPAPAGDRAIGLTLSPELWARISTLPKPDETAPPSTFGFGYVPFEPFQDYIGRVMCGASASPGRIAVDISADCKQFLGELEIPEEWIEQMVNKCDQGLVDSALTRLIAAKWFDGNRIVFIDGSITDKIFKLEPMQAKIKRVSIRLAIELRAILPAGPIDKSMTAEQILEVTARSFGVPVSCHPEQPRVQLYTGPWDGKTITVDKPSSGESEVCVVCTAQPDKAAMQWAWALDTEKYREWLLAERAS